jgi:hypothetical protein
MPEKEPIEIPPRGTRGTKMPFQGAFMKIAKPFADMQVSRSRRAKDATAPMMMGFPTIMLTTVGARSGSERTHVLRGFQPAPLASHRLAFMRKMSHESQARSTLPTTCPELTWQRV